MTDWGPLSTGSGGTRRTGKNLGLFASSGGRVVDPAAASPTGTANPTTGATPGTFDLSPIAPIDSAVHVKQEGENYLAGLKNALFGTSAADYTGHHGGILGDVPIIGDVTRAASETVANAGNAVLSVGKAGLDTVGGALEHVDFRSPQENQQLQAQFDAVPDSPEKQAALQQMQADPGAKGHYMATVVNTYIKQQEEQGNWGKPDLMGNLHKVPGSAAEAVDNLLGMFAMPSRAVERWWTDLGTPGQHGYDRLATIMAVGDGTMAFGEDKGLLGTGILQGQQTQGGLNDIEKIVYDHVKSGEWTDAQAKDFLASHGSGYSHSALANIAGEVAIDPQNLATLGFATVGRVGIAAGKVAEAMSTAERAIAETNVALNAARAAGDTEKASALAAKLLDDSRILDTLKAATYRSAADNVSILNPLGKAAQNERVSGFIKTLAKTYEPLQQAHVTKAYKVVKTIVDPLGNMTLHNPFRTQMFDLMTEAGTRHVIAGYGDITHANTVHSLLGVAGGAHIADAFSKNIGTYSGNLIRRVIARTQRTAAVAGGMGDQLVGQSIDTAIEGLAHNAPKDFFQAITEEANRFRQFEWSEQDLINLSNRMEKVYHGQSAEDWLKWLKDSNLGADGYGLLHASTYGGMTDNLVRAVAKAVQAGGEDVPLYKRLVLVNRKTLTKQGAAGLITQMNEAADDAARLEVIKSAQDLYPELANFTPDVTDLADTAKRFVKQIERKQNHLPSQLTNDELVKLPDDLRTLHDDNVYTLGFAPEDRFKWGLERSNDAEGKYAPVGDVWVDHIAPGYQMMAGTREQWAVNILGQTITAKPLRTLAHAADYIESGIKIMNHSVSGRIIAETAKARFIEKTTKRFGDVGITEDVAKSIMKKFDDAIQGQDIVVRPSGFSSSQMWHVAESAIPTGVSRREFGPVELMKLVLESYEGDVRTVGLTQKLSSRIKRVLSLSGNNASMLAEQAYPLLKYRLNPIFQLQEKVEPWVLNAWRGITPARSGSALSKADKETETLINTLIQHSLVYNADHEMAEYAANMLYGKTIEQLAKSNTSKMGEIARKYGVDWGALRDVKGVKQVNMLRTFRHGLGNEMKQAWEKTHPGEWDKMFAEAQRRSGNLILNEDEFAVRLMSEQLIASDVMVEKLASGERNVAGLFGNVDYRNAIMRDIWSPAYLGEMRSTDINQLARVLAFPMDGGKVTADAKDLRSLLASGKIEMADVERALRHINAHPDYIARVRNALDFSWDGFWNQVAHDFNIDPTRIAELQDIIGNAASMRGMTPVDYLSQIITPSIATGDPEAALKHIQSINAVLDRTQGGARMGLTVGSDAAGNEAQFIDQMAGIFAAHLDPSAKVGLLQAFYPTLREEIRQGNLWLDLNQIDNLWNESGAASELGRYILGEMNMPQQNLWDLHQAGLLNTVQQWDAVDPHVPQTLVTWGGAEIPGHPTQLIAPSIRNAPPEVQRMIMQPLGEMRDVLPTTRIGRVEISKDLSRYMDPGEDAIGTQAVTLESKQQGHALIFSRDWYGGPGYEQRWAEQATSVGASGKFAGFTNEAGGLTPRESVYGAPNFAMQGPEATVAHEYAHAVHEQAKARYAELISAKKGRTKEARALKRYLDLFDNQMSSAGMRRVSEYATERGTEAAAEATMLAVYPSATPAGLIDQMSAPFVQAEANRLADPMAKLVNARQAVKGDPKAAVDFLDEVNVLYPGIDTTELGSYIDDVRYLEMVNDAPQALADSKEAMNREVQNIIDEIKAMEKDNPVLAGNLAEFQSGPQSVQDVVTQIRKDLTDAGIYRPPEAKNPIGAIAQDPEIVRATQMFGKWTTGVMGDYMRRGGNAQLSAVLDKIAGIPTHNATPYNFTQHMLMQNMEHGMVSKWQDAFRLQYYSKSRPMWERSMNHPMFGIYPASYMWGKMLPEITNFMLRNPFGLRSGTAAYTLADVQKAVAVQHEWNTEFNDQMENFGHSAFMFSFGYMLPTWPWESGAAMSAWSRELAQEGLDMQARAESGGTVANKAGDMGLNAGQIMGKATDLLNPARMVDAAVFKPAREINPPTVNPAPSADNPYFSQPGIGPTAGANLAPELSDALSQLRDSLGG